MPLNSLALLKSIIYTPLGNHEDALNEIAPHRSAPKREETPGQAEMMPIWPSL